MTIHEKSPITPQEGAAALAESLIQVMGSRAAFETCMTSQWFDVAEQIYKLSLTAKEQSD